jgi:hypothetical protein
MGAVINAMTGMEPAFLAGNSLDQQTRVLIEKYAH